MRRGRRHPRELQVWDPLDFWRVEVLEPAHLLRLRAEMKLPGQAWLQFEVLPDPEGSRVEQTAFFKPAGCWATATGIRSCPSTGSSSPGSSGS